MSAREDETEQFSIPPRPRRRARFFFDVMNLPLTRDLVCGGFTLSPLEDPDNLFETLERPGARNVRTAQGYYDVQQPVPEPGEDRNEFVRAADIEFGRRADALTVLASFAGRRSVRFYDPLLYVEMEGKQAPSPDLCRESSGVTWHYRGGNRLRAVFRGRAYGHPWYFTQGELEGFLQRNFDVLVIESEGAGHNESQDRRLRLAMFHLGACRADDSTEWQFLKAWTGLEALINWSPEKRKHLPLSENKPNEMFDRVKETVRAAIKSMPEDIRPTRPKREAMFDKLIELNREALIPSALRFFNRVFREYPEQTVSRADLRTFLDIRNSITHSGIMDLDALKLPVGFPYDYGSVLVGEKLRLIALLERTILALLHERPHLMDIPWQQRGFSR